MRISRATIPFDDTTILLETLGQILDVHQKLEATESIMSREKENQTQNRTVDVEENRDPIKRRCPSNLPFADIAALNLISGA